MCGSAGLSHFRENTRATVRVLFQLLGQVHHQCERCIVWFYVNCRMCNQPLPTMNFVEIWRAKCPVAMFGRCGCWSWAWRSCCCQNYGAAQTWFIKGIKELVWQDLEVASKSWRLVRWQVEGIWCWRHRFTVFAKPDAIHGAVLAEGLDNLKHPGQQWFCIIALWEVIS